MTALLHARARGRFLLSVVALFAALLASTGVAAAHPLGNFTINHYSELRVSGDTMYVLYVLDMAEIPTLQHGAEVRASGYGAGIGKQLKLTIGGTPTTLHLLDSSTHALAGSAGLKTTRFEAIYSAPDRGGAIVYHDGSFAGRLGWREVVAASDAGARISGSSVPTHSITNGLRHYPKSQLSSPLDVTDAAFTAKPSTQHGVQPRLGTVGAQATTRRGGGFERLMTGRHLSTAALLLTLLAALFWGAAHALTPGHGKSIVAGYLVGKRGRKRDAVLLGMTVTVTHTIGVFALGFITLGLSKYIVPEQLYPLLSVGSGLMIVGVGANILRLRLRSGTWDDHHHGDGSHGHGHDHGHSHAHAHEHAPAPAARERVQVHAQTVPASAATTGTRGILSLGIAAGVLPCPSALVVLLSAIALHPVAFGMVLIIAFSVGLALTITLIGLVAVLARSRFQRASFDGRVIRALPALSAVLITVLGLAITIKALPGAAAVL